MATELLGGGLASGKTIYFDALLNDGLDQANYLIWAQQPHEPPAGEFPNSDARVFAPVTLE